MKILFFTRRFYPDIGGVEAHVMEITKRLIEKGHSVTIVTESSESGGRHLASKGVENGDIDPTIYRIPVPGSEKQKKFVIWQWLWKHRKLLAEADVIHAHDVFYWYIPFRFVYPQKKVYTTFHGYETVYPPKANAIRLRKLSAYLSHGTINVGDFIKKWYGTHPDYVTYGGVSENKNSELKIQNEGKKLSIVFMGRLERDMGIEKYIELLKILKQNKVAYSFKALGDGSYKQILHSYGETPGFVADMRKEIAHADIIFASSYLSILQALSYQKLVVSLYDNPLKKDYLLMTPFARFCIVEKSELEAYKKIKYYTLNPNRKQQILADEYAWVQNQTWDAVVKLYLSLWKKK